MCKTNDGFKVAKADLEMRGPGDFFSANGTFRQHGGVEMPFSSGLTDGALLASAVDEAAEVIKIDPALTFPEHTQLSLIVSKMRKDRENTVS